MTPPFNLPTLRAAITKTLWEHIRKQATTSVADTSEAILATLSDPAVMDELARWLIERGDGPFEIRGQVRFERGRRQISQPSEVWMNGTYVWSLRQRIRSET